MNVMLCCAEPFESRVLPIPMSELMFHAKRDWNCVPVATSVCRDDRIDPSAFPPLAVLPVVLPACAEMLWAAAGETASERKMAASTEVRAPRGTLLENVTGCISTPVPGLPGGKLEFNRPVKPSKLSRCGGEASGSPAPRTCTALFQGTGRKTDLLVSFQPDVPSCVHTPRIAHSSAPMYTCVTMSEVESDKSP